MNCPIFYLPTSCNFRGSFTASALSLPRFDTGLTGQNEVRQLARLKRFKIGPSLVLLAALIGFPLSTLAQWVSLTPPDQVRVSVNTSDGGFTDSQATALNPVFAELERFVPGRLSGSGQVNYSRASADLNTASLRGFVRGGEGNSNARTNASVETYLQDWIDITASPGTPMNQPVSGTIHFHLDARFGITPPSETGFNGPGMVPWGSPHITQTDLRFSSQVLANNNSQQAGIGSFYRRVRGLGSYTGSILDSFNVTHSRQNGIDLLNRPPGGGSFPGPGPELDIRADNTQRLELTYSVPFQALPGERLFLDTLITMSTGSSAAFIGGGEFFGYYEIDLPSDYGFTSQSGVFALQPIPEPKMMAAILGIVALGTIFLRRRR
jgi:hypothetical protein